MSTAAPPARRHNRPSTHLNKLGPSAPTPPPCAVEPSHTTRHTFPSSAELPLEYAVSALLSCRSGVFAFFTTCPKNHSHNVHVANQRVPETLKSCNSDYTTPPHVRTARSSTRALPRVVYALNARENCWFVDCVGRMWRSSPVDQESAYVWGIMDLVRQ